MIDIKTAIEKAKKAYPDVELFMGTLCGSTYAFTAIKDGELVSGSYGIDANTGEPCYGIDVRNLAKSFERNRFEV